MRKTFAILILCLVIVSVVAGFTAQAKVPRWCDRLSVGVLGVDVIKVQRCVPCPLNLCEMAPEQESELPAGIVIRRSSEPPQTP